jgi:tRNA U34 5-methylaminomethyl-2-thiouridine-forming methyltransferase MnmC
LLPGGVLVTYSSKTTARNAMKQAGFTIRKIPGPYGKREMVRAEKAIDA